MYPESEAANPGDHETSGIGVEDLAWEGYPESPMERPLVVLVVDDEPDVIELVRRELEREGQFVVHFTCDGKSAVSMAKDHQPDIILLDVMMPGMSGFETCKALKRDPSTEHISVVMLTVRQDSRAIEQAFEAGAANYLMKPIRFGSLAAQLRATLDKQRPA